MRLYAKVRSDRAGKGQGGNSFIDIELHAFNRKKIVARVIMRIRKDHDGKPRGYEILYQDPDQPETTKLLKAGHEIDGTLDSIAF